MGQNKNVKLLQQYIDGETNEEETVLVEKIMAAGTTDPILKNRLNDDWKTTQSVDGPGLTHILDRVHRIIHKKELSKQTSGFNRFIQVYAKIAAVLLIPILISGALFFMQQKSRQNPLPEQQATSTIYAPLGSRVAFNLPDGSTGYLNSGSSISYSIPFTQNRNIQLKGEAWFDVAKDPKHPLTLNTNGSQVKVLGTSFNISAYSDEDYVEVVLAEGSVAFCAAETEAVILNPSERLVYSNKTIVIEKTDPEKFKGWTEGKLIFRGDNMGELVRRIERWYNIDVEIADKEMEAYTFRATFEDDSLNEVLRFLTVTSQINCQTIPGGLSPDGIWGKEKVILTIRK